jgi:hypothetical protein
MNKKIAIGLIALMLLLGIAWQGRSNSLSYYNGDAVNYQGNLFVATANTGAAEIFKLNGHQLQRIFDFKPYNGAYAINGDFSSIVLNVENSHLFAYATNAYTLYKYDLSDLQNPILVDKRTNTYYEWYSRVAKFGGHIVTISKNNITIWNGDMQAINSVKLGPIDNLNNIAFDNTGRFIYYIQDGKINIYDIEARQLIGQTAVLNFYKNNDNHQLAPDMSNNQLVAIDNYFLKKYDGQGNLLTDVHNPGSGAGAALIPDNGTNYYFSTGDTIIRSNQETLKINKTVNPYALGGADSWAMDLQYVDNGGQDWLVVFDNSNILVLDKNLNKVAQAALTERSDNQQTATENLWLRVDHMAGAAGATVNVTGGGYWPNEKLQFNLANTNTLGQADNQGRFNQAIVIPTTTIGGHDIKVSGLNSSSTYSISFTVTK